MAHRRLALGAERQLVLALLELAHEVMLAHSRQLARLPLRRALRRALFQLALRVRLSLLLDRRLLLDGERRPQRPVARLLAREGVGVPDNEAQNNVKIGSTTRPPPVRLVGLCAFILYRSQTVPLGREARPGELTHTPGTTDPLLLVSRTHPVGSSASSGFAGTVGNPYWWSPVTSFVKINRPARGGHNNEHSKRTPCTPCTAR